MCTGKLSAETDLGNRNSLIDEYDVAYDYAVILSR